jgi:glycosyltransferase involved in cell wall biosynthesis
MQSPLFSVIIPCYNSASTLLQTLESAATQTVKEIEIIVVDDGSSDEGPARVAEFAAADPRVRLLRQANSGVSTARNRGVQESRGKFIAFLDADDLWDPRYLETHAQRFARDESLGVSFSVIRFIDAHGRASGQVSKPRLVGLDPAEILATNPCTTCSAIVVRRTTIEEVGAFDTALRRAEDQEWLFRVSVSGWKIEGDPAPLVAYRNSVGGLSSSLAEMYDSYLEMLEKARALRPNLVERHRKVASARMLRYLARRALRLQHGRALARSYVLRALREGPAIALREPKQTLATIAAAFIPGVDQLFNVLGNA